MRYLTFPVMGILAYAIEEMFEQSNQNSVSIMEFGCGTGRYTSQLSGIFPSSIVTGYDIDKKRIDEARRLYNAENLNYTSQKPEQRFDSVVSSAVIHEDPEALIPEMVSFVKPGGLAGIVDYDMKGV